MASIEEIKEIIFKDALKIDDSYLLKDSTFSNSILDKTRKIKIQINNEETVIFCYPTTINTDTRQVHIQCNKNLPKAEREAVWNWCCSRECKFFFLTAFKDTNKIYDNYIVSIETLKPTEDIPDTITFEDKEYKQVLESNTSKFIRIKAKKHKNIYLSFIKKEHLNQYLTYFDNRPYMYSDTMNKENIIVEPTEFLEIEKDKMPIKFHRNRLIFGAPGTGKSYLLKKNHEELSEKLLYVKEDGSVNYEKIDAIAKRLNIKPDDIRYNSMKNATCISDCIRVTFHQEYSYSDFVGTYKPVSKPNGSGITYEFIPGPFTISLVNALKNPEKNYLIIIEEINRANAASVFGDVFQLLDRNNEGYSIYDIKPSKEMEDYLKKEFQKEDIGNIIIPANLYIWATMNSADQGVYPMDSAFKRRWSFEYMPIDGSDEDKEIDNFYIYLSLSKGGGFEECKWNVFRKMLNNKLKTLDIEEDRLIGPRFLSKTDLADPESCKQAVVNKLFAYLRQDVLRYNSSELFNKDLKNMSDIREMFFNESKTIGDILNFQFDEYDLKKLRRDISKAAGEAAMASKADNKSIGYEIDGDVSNEN